MPCLTNMLDKLAQGPLRARRHRCIDRRATRGLSELRGLVHQCLPYRSSVSSIIARNLSSRGEVWSADQTRCCGGNRHREQRERP